MYETTLAIGAIIFGLGTIWSLVNTVAIMVENWDLNKPPKRGMGYVLVYLTAFLAFAFMFYGFMIKLPLPP